MRLLLAKTLALVTGILVVLLSMLFALVQQQPSSEQLPGQTQERLSDSADTSSMLILGKQVVDEERCRTCHSIGGVGNRRHHLDGVGSRLTEQEIRTWIIAPREMKPGVIKPAYGHLPQAHIDTLVKYIMSLKK